MNGHILLKIIFFYFLSSIAVHGQSPDTTFYPDGNIQQLVIYLPKDITKYISFDNKGRITKIFHQGYFMACGTAIGTDTIFYNSGNIKETVFYDNRKNEKEDGCHSSWTTEIKTEYFTAGKIKSKTSYKYSYEGDPCPCGIWKYYNANSKLIKQKKFGNCYNQQVDCDK